MSATYTALQLSLAAAFGVCLGSFANVVIYRLPIMLSIQWGETPGRGAFNLAKPRSFCPACNTQLAWYENIPVLSWLVQRGKCRTCCAPIAARYPAIELLFGAVALTMLALHGPTVQALAMGIFVMALIVLALIDHDTRLLPDALTLPTLAIGVLYSTLSGIPAALSSVAGATLGYGVPALVTWLYFKLRGQIGMGQGDWKLLAAIGAWLGWTAVMPVLFVASLLGLVAGLGRLALNKHSGAMAFGPCLVLAALAWMTPGVQKFVPPFFV